jgi:1-deoxy-D-xylulose-5-phosphate reductoisomerase
VKRVVVLGSTGSIGTQTLDVLGQLSDRFEVVGLAAGRWTSAFQQQIERWQPDLVATAAPDAPALHGRVRVLNGARALEALIEETDPDVAVIGTPGMVGLDACLAVLRAGKIAAIANKEPLVTAGALVMEAARRYGGTIVPVDSEHSGVWQCLRGEDAATVSNITITSSGGAFRDAPLESLESATPEQALQHPTWSMGPKITIDSATLMNKALEIIEACWLFEVPHTLVSVVLHRQSIVHALVEFSDGSVKAQLAVPDMRLPIVNALTYPDRVPIEVPRLDVARMGTLTFEPVDEKRYPSIPLARATAEQGESYPAVMNAANEVAVERFLAGEIGFTEIVPLVASTLDRHNGGACRTLEDVIEVDRWARETAHTLQARRASVSTSPS